MADVAISAEGLAKRYLIGHAAPERGSDETFRESVTRGVRQFGRSALATIRGRQIIAGDETEEFWALDDVSFEVRRGEVVGVIGRNGAGKSTLLKILSRITEPTRGRAVINGRVSSLLEVGTGFHPELTGRENIYLNGAILGMSRAEIRAKFDEIVAFAEIERFLDTPVKRYSSGMYVRLAFSVAAHLEPEILIVDEVLAVGDAEFQRRCLGKMGDIVEGGRTVLFVSHQMAAVQSLCQSVMVLSGGRVTFLGDADEGVARYLAETAEASAQPLELRADRRGSGALRFTSVGLRSGGPERLPGLICGRTATFELHFSNGSEADLRRVNVGVAIDSHHGQRVLTLYSDFVGQGFKTLPADASSVEIEIPTFPLQPGRYRYTLYATVDGALSDLVRDAGVFEVGQGDFYGTGRFPQPEHGVFLARHSFRIGERAIPPAPGRRAGAHVRR